MRTNFGVLTRTVQDTEAHRVVRELHRAYITTEHEFIRMHPDVVRVIVEGAIRTASLSHSASCTILENLDVLLGRTQTQTDTE